jgi:hypothetical protein
MNPRAPGFRGFGAHVALGGIGVVYRPHGLMWSLCLHGRAIRKARDTRGASNDDIGSLSVSCTSLWFSWPSCWLVPRLPVHPPHCFMLRFGLEGTERNLWRPGGPGSPRTGAYGLISYIGPQTTTTKQTLNQAIEGLSKDTGSLNNSLEGRREAPDGLNKAFKA